MHARLALGLAALGAALGPSAVAHANATQDFKNGSTLWLRVATVQVEDELYSSGGMPLPKQAGALDLDLPASSLGVAIPATLHLHGVDTGSGGIIDYSIDQSFSPALDVTGEGDWYVQRIVGHLRVHVWRVPGNLPGDKGSVYLEVLPDESTLTAIGNWGAEDIQIREASFFGGTPPPFLASFNYGGDVPLCSSTLPVEAPMNVWLAQPAPPGGASVQLTSADPAGVALPTWVNVAGGAMSAAFTAVIAPGYSGLVHITAAGAGAIRTLDLPVNGASACQPGDDPWYFATWLPKLLAGCASCSQFVAWNDEGDQLALVNGRPEFAHAGTLVDLAKLFGSASAIVPSALNNFGAIAGTMTVNGVAQAFRANLVDGDHAAELLGAMTPLALNAYGVVVGYRTIAGTTATRAVYSSGRGVVDLPVVSPLGVASSAARLISSHGQIVGTYTDGHGAVHGFRLTGGTTYTLPVVGARPALPAALNEVGQIAVNSVDASGVPIAAVISPSGGVRLLGVPSGYASFEAKAMNRWGWVAGVASLAGGRTKAAFVWTPSRGFVALSGYARGLTATDALRITDANRVVIRGTYDNVTDLYVVGL